MLFRSVGVTVAVGVGVLVGVGVPVDVGIRVGAGVGVAVFVGTGLFVGVDKMVGDGEYKEPVSCICFVPHPANNRISIRTLHVNCILFLV